MIKIGIHNAYASADWSGVDYMDVMKRISGLGFDFIEANPSKFLEMPKSQRQEIRALAQDLGLGIICSFGLPYKYDLSSEDETTRNNGVAYCKEILKVIHEMGSDIYAGCNYSYWPFRYTSPMPDRRKLLDNSVKSVKELCKMAEDLEIDYSIEVLNRFEHYLLNTAKEGVEYCERIDSPRIKLNMDTFHMNIEEDSLTESLIYTKDYLTDVHVGENNRKFPGMGYLPWRDIINALKSFNYDKYICLEPFVVPGGEAALDVYLWRDLLDDVGADNMDKLAKASLTYLRSLIDMN